MSEIRPKPEGIEGEFEKKEAERKTPSIRMEFFRHDEKDKVEGQPYNKIKGKVSKRGKERAQDLGKQKNHNPEVGMVYGSPRTRSTETAYHQLLAEEEGITPDTSIEEIEEKINKELKMGKGGRKNIETPLLDFNWRGDFQKVANKWYKDGKVTDFMFSESDDLAKKLGDLESTSYSRSASNVAEIVNKYVKILPKWERIVEKDTKGKYAEFGNEMQRFLGSHGSVLESFLLKIIEKTDSRDAAEESLGTLIDHKGFSPSEGFSLQMQSNESGEVEINITCKDKEWNISPEVIDDIINDAKELDENIKAEK